MSTKIQKPSLGRVVLVALRDKQRERTVERPAIVVSVDMGGSDGINCRPLLDGSNDRGIDIGRDEHGAPWLTSVHYNADASIPEGQTSSWRYPPHVADQIDIG